jgi:dihydroxyacetone kinase-like predicted kinase
MGESVVVTGNRDMVKVHIHTEDPGPVLTFGISLGTLRQITVENLDEQHQDFISLQRTEQEVPEVDILAVTWGDGFTKVFQSLGARGIVPTGEVMNPSARELLECIEGLSAKEVIVLPNNPNVIPVAEQTATLASKPIHVIRSRTLPQGIAAILAFNPDESAEVNVPAMSNALGTVSTVAITKAIRSSSVKGVQVQKGGYIGLVDDVLVCSGRSIAKVLLESLQHADIDNRSLVTLFWGNGVSEAQATRTANRIRKDFPDIEVEPMSGAQPLYQYILSVE